MDLSIFVEVWNVWTQSTPLYNIANNIRQGVISIQTYLAHMVPSFEMYIQGHPGKTSEHQLLEISVQPQKVPTNDG
jgi:hypothetical protein